MGYSQAGFDEIVGIDIKPQKHYPFEFIQGDALDLRRGDLAGFDLIHASPPCQAFTRARHLRAAQGGETQALDLLMPTRELLSGHEFVIENVPGAPLRAPAVLCGSAFGLRVRRHRCFETTFPLTGTTYAHKEQGRPVGVYHRMADDIPHGGRTARTLEEGQAAMGITWMPWDELKEAIPPAYTKYIGERFLAGKEAAG